MGTLSGGQRRPSRCRWRRSVVRSCCTPPRWIPRAEEQIMNVIEHLVRKHSLTTLMGAHSMAQAVRFGDRTIMMHRGLIVADLS